MISEIDAVSSFMIEFDKLKLGFIPSKIDGVICEEGHLLVAAGPVRIGTNGYYRIFQEKNFLDADMKKSFFEYFDIRNKIIASMDLMHIFNNIIDVYIRLTDGTLIIIDGNDRDESWNISFDTEDKVFHFSCPVYV